MENPENEMGTRRRQNPRQSGGERGEQRGKGGVGTPGSLERGSLEMGVWKNHPVKSQRSQRRLRSPATLFEQRKRVH